MKKLLLILLLSTPAFAQWITHSMNIPLAHPRLFWNSTRLSAAQTWLAAHPFTAVTDTDIAFQSYVNGSSCTTAVNDATSFLVPYNEWNSAANGSDFYRGQGEPYLLVFDWCYSAFSTSSLGTTTLSTSIVAGQAVAVAVGSTTGMFVGEVLTLAAPNAENVIVDQVTDGTHVRIQNVLNSHTNGITITLMNQRDSFENKFLIWAQGIQAQTWGGSQTGGMVMSNYYWGNMRNEFEIGVITYGDVGSGGGSAPDNLIDDALTTRWTNEIVADAATNGSLSGGVPQEGSEYGAAQYQYWLIPMLSAKNMGRDLSTETPFFKQLLAWTLYTTSPAVTLIKDFSITQFAINSWSDDEVTASAGGILWGRDYLEDGMNSYAQLYSSLNIGKYARQWLNSFPTVAPLALDPQASSTRNYYVSNYIFSSDPGGSASAYTALPLDYYATGYQAGVMKAAWDSTSSYVFYQFSNAASLAGNNPGTALGGHEHPDWGNFDIWRGGKYLTRKTIEYSENFAGEPNIGAGVNQPIGGDIHLQVISNVLAFTNVAIGGQANTNQMVPGPRLGNPVVTRLESQTNYGYAVADLTSVYKWDSNHLAFNTGVVGSVVRELLYVRSLETLIVFDRVVTNAQSVGGSLTAAQVVTSALHHYEVSPTQDGGGSDYNHWTETNGTQVLRQTVLIPTGLTSSNARLINESSCGGCDAVGQFRLDIDNSGAATRYHLSVLQARDTSGSNLTATMVDSNGADPTSGTFTVTLAPAVGSNTVIVFNKGATSIGGTINVAAAGAVSLRSNVEPISYTDSGPLWGTATLTGMYGGSSFTGGTVMK